MSLNIDQTPAYAGLQVPELFAGRGIFSMHANASRLMYETFQHRPNPMIVSPGVCTVASDADSLQGKILDKPPVD